MREMYIPELFQSWCAMDLEVNLSGLWIDCTLPIQNEMVSFKVVRPL